jgi:NADPH:quinone reductase-like Zn-dependent oxidoreductase
MRAVAIHRTGDLDAIEHQAPEPEPGDGEVLIAVRAAGVNPVDWKYRRGLVARPLPAVLGEDVSGVVAISRARGFAPGDAVFGVVRSGGQAELAVAAADALAHKPAALSHEQAAALPVSALTAWQGLFDRGRLAAGQTVLVAGAAGGIGHLAVQLARHAGARVIGTGSAGDRDFVIGLGADEFVDYRRQDVAEAVHDADVALDTVGGAVTATLVPCLRDGGTLVTLAYPPEVPPPAPGRRVESLAMHPDAGQLTRIAQLAADGELRPTVSATFPLAEARRAQEASERGHVRGKLVLIV